MHRMRTRAFAAALAALLAAGTPGPAHAQGAAAPDHLECAAAYMTLSIGMPYLPGIFTMFTLAPRSGYAQRIYGQSTPQEQRLGNRELREEVERRYRARLAALEEGDENLEMVIVDVHACDAKYGHKPARLSLKDFERK